jgi:uncharacterized membrane protein HdeD (DUF308 family)
LQLGGFRLGPRWDKKPSGGALRLAGERRKGLPVVGLGILALVIGIVLWLTVMPAVGWILMAIGAILIVVGILMGAVWSFSRAAGPRTY